MVLSDFVYFTGREDFFSIRTSLLFIAILHSRRGNTLGNFMASGLCVVLSFSGQTQCASEKIKSD